MSEIKGAELKAKLINLNVERAVRLEKLEALVLVARAVVDETCLAPPGDFYHSSTEWQSMEELKEALEGLKE
jgi:hypothetical protein